MTKKPYRTPKGKLQRRWYNIKERCFNPKNPNYKNYGAKGITVCERWLVFENFYQDMGIPGIGLSVDRIDNTKGYSPENCRWATNREQALNKSTSVNLTWMGGKTQSLREWCEEYNKQAYHIYRCIEIGQPFGVSLQRLGPYTKRHLQQAEARKRFQDKKKVG